MADTRDSIEIPYAGHVDGIAEGAVSGWAWVPGHPDSPVDIEVRQDGRLVAVALADQYRPDLDAAGIGRGRHGFRAVLPPDLAAGVPLRVAVAGCDGCLPGSPLDLPVAPPVEGQIDGVVSGALHGWARGPDAEPVTVELLCDGIPLAWTRADGARPGLPPNGRGFAIPLPGAVLDGDGHRLEARVRGHGVMLRGGPLAVAGLCAADGALTGASGGRLLGHARPAARSDRAPMLELWDGGQFLLSFVGGSAPDFGFVLDLPASLFDGAGHDLRVTDALGRDLAGSPVRYRALPPPAGAAVPAQEWAGFEGRLDHVVGRQLTGWAWCRFAPGRAVEIELCDGDAVVDRFTADLWREDLAAAGIGDGRHGFRRDVPAAWLDGAPRTVILRITGDGVPLAGTPTARTFHPPTGGAARFCAQTAPPSGSDARLEAMRLALVERDRQIAALAADLAVALGGRAPRHPGGAPPAAARRVAWAAPPDVETRPSFAEAEAMLARVARDLPLDVRRIGLTPEELPQPLDLLLVPETDSGATAALPVILAALARGVPVLAAAAPDLPASLRDLVMRDWERTARQHLLRSPAHRSVPLAAGRVVRLLVLFDGVEEVDLLEPVLAAAARRRHRVAVTALLTTHLAARAPRARGMLERHGIPCDVVERDALLGGIAPDLRACDAVLVGAESDDPAHRVPHALVRRAAAEGLATFAVQHGLETIGLTYFDEVHGPGVRIAAGRILTWFPAEAAPPELAADVRSRLSPVGSLREPSLARPALPLDDDRPLVGVFENLHWHRYDDGFRRAFVTDLLATAAARPDLRFLLKPHHSARWLCDALPSVRPDNTVLADPRSPDWEPFAAPALMPALAAVITTPSTVAHDAARAARPVAVAGGDLVLAGFAPLPILRRAADWTDFLDGALAPEGGAAALAANLAFLDRHMVPGPAGERILDLICAEAGKRA